MTVADGIFPPPENGNGRSIGDDVNDSQSPLPLTLRDLMITHRAMRPVVIDHLLRVGESMNVISASKIGKSWTVNDLAVSTASGIPWLGSFQTTESPVLMIDNELHPETLTHRLQRVATARGVDLHAIADKIHVLSLRGRLMDIFALRKYLKQFRPGDFGVICVDAWYRCLPAGCDENDNGAMAQQYNIVDQCADDLQTCFVFVHHSSKGNQSDKAVTDVGSGAGSMSRAADSHLVMRHHEEDGAVVLEAAVRSFPSIDPVCLRWNFPTWTPAPDLDPTQLRQARKRGAKAAAENTPKKPELNIDQFVELFLTSEPKTREIIEVSANLSGVSFRKTDTLLKAAIAEGKVFVWRPRNPKEPQRFATTQPHLFDSPQIQKRGPGRPRKVTP